MTTPLTVRVLVDVTNDFVSGPFGSEAARVGIPAMLEFITLPEQVDEMVIVTWEDHGAIYEESHENLKFAVPHGVRDSEGARLYGVIAEYMDQKAVEGDRRFMAIAKDRFMAYGSDKVIAEAIKNYRPTEDHQDGREVTFILAGLVTNICVIANAVYLQGAFPWAKIVLDAGACVGVTPELHKAAMEVMASMAMTVINS